MLIFEHYLYIKYVDGQLILPLQYQLLKTASDITDRRDVSVFASGSGVYTPVGGTRVIRINLNCANWLVPHGLRFMRTLTNTTIGHMLGVICNPWSFCSQRMRVMCGGQVVEYTTGYNRVHEMISRLESSEDFKNDDIYKIFI